MKVAGGGGGWGCGCGSYDISMVDRMMLRFRPIAPKPVASSGYVSGESTTVNDSKSGGGKPKRKYVNNNKKKDKNNNKKRKVLMSKSPEIVSGGGDTVVTLPLMPETPDRNKEKSPVITKISSSPTTPTTPTSWLLTFKNNKYNQRVHETASFVTVERVMNTRVVDMGCNGLVDWRAMESDTCPRFISDGGDKVVWTNKAYKEMVGGGVVVLVRKLAGGWPAEFTCHVRVTWGNGVSLTVPCDTWILEGGSGGYVWRLDVKAALSLGR